MIGEPAAGASVRDTAHMTDRGNGRRSEALRAPRRADRRGRCRRSWTPSDRGCKRRARGRWPCSRRSGRLRPGRRQAAAAGLLLLGVPGGGGGEPRRRGADRAGRGRHRAAAHDGAGARRPDGRRDRAAGRAHHGARIALRAHERRHPGRSRSVRHVGGGAGRRPRGGARRPAAARERVRAARAGAGARRPITRCVSRWRWVSSSTSRGWRDEPAVARGRRPAEGRRVHGGGAAAGRRRLRRRRDRRCAQALRCATAGRWARRSSCATICATVRRRPAWTREAVRRPGSARRRGRRRPAHRSSRGADRRARRSWRRWWRCRERRPRCCCVGRSATCLRAGWARCVRTVGRTSPARWFVWLDEELWVSTRVGDTHVGARRPRSTGVDRDRSWPRLGRAGRRQDRRAWPRRSPPSIPTCGRPCPPGTRSTDRCWAAMSFERLTQRRARRWGSCVSRPRASTHGITAELLRTWRSLRRVREPGVASCAFEGMR